MKIYFDMDGTIANLYDIENWFEKLRKYDPSPYLEAKPMVDMRKLSFLLKELSKNGVEIGIISWLSKTSNYEYDRNVRNAKKRWLYKNCGSVPWDTIHLVKYGTYKHAVENAKDAILFDDNQHVRELWEKNGGIAFDPQEYDICSILKNLLE